MDPSWAPAITGSSWWLKLSLCLACRQIHSQPSCVNVEKLDYPISFTYLLPRKTICKIPFTILSTPWNFYVQQPTTVFRFLLNDHELPSQNLHSPSSPKRRFGRESSCCVSFFWKAWNASLGLRRDNRKKKSRSGLPCTSSPSWTFALRVCPSTLEAMFMMTPFLSHIDYPLS